MKQRILEPFYKKKIGLEVIEKARSVWFQTFPVCGVVPMEMLSKTRDFGL